MNNIPILNKLISMAGISNMLLMIAAGFLSGLTGIGLMGAAAWIISYAALQPPLYALTIGITCVRFFGLSRAATRYLMRLFSHQLAFKAYEQLQLLIYGSMCKQLPLRTGLPQQGQYLQQLSNDAETLRDTYIRWFLPIASTGLLTLCLTLWLQTVSMSAACLLCFLYGLHLIIPAIMTRNTEENLHEAPYRDKLVDYALGQDELITSGSIKSFIAGLDQAAATYSYAYNQVQLRQETIDALLSLLRHVGFIIYICLLINALSLNLVEPHWLAVWVLLGMGLFNEFYDLASAVPHLHKAHEAAQHIFNTEDLSSHDDQPAPSSTSPEAHDTTEAILRGKGVTFTYNEGAPKPTPVFTPLSFALSPGEMLAIRGDSGSGKTTLAQLLLKFWPVTTGELQLGDIAYNNWSTPELRKYFSASIQPCHIFAESIRDNFIRLHPHITEEKIWYALNIAQLGDTVRQFPHQLDETLGENGHRLSGGQRNRLLTALAVASDAPYLILDEPTDGLDKYTAASLVDALIAHAHKTQKALLIITHDEEVARKLPQEIHLTPPTTH
ncbi:thiol reductant ABC exporter subunit CydC [Anaerovibrio lipolyticus]|uniref:thiol reductant ABC exporter subunit CydC n=1 Tax=Anaerovibrio lipolyticus TaxID=82374 RepID=UPI0025E6E2D9|nr:thiol reductant ABC exporter subunit CydC [Anaerovibrio lipolyticus]